MKTVLEANEVDFEVFALSVRGPCSECGTAALQTLGVQVDKLKLSLASLQEECAREKMQMEDASAAMGARGGANKRIRRSPRIGKKAST